MTQDEIIEMVNQVGCKSYTPPPTRSVAGVSMTFAQVEALIKLAAGRERKACAELRNKLHAFDGKGRQEIIDVMSTALDEYQAAIRARGDKHD